MVDCGLLGHLLRLGESILKGESIGELKERSDNDSDLRFGGFPAARCKAEGEGECSSVLDCVFTRGGDLGFPILERSDLS